MEKLLGGMRGPGPAGVYIALLQRGLAHHIAMRGALCLGRPGRDGAPSMFCSQWAFRSNHCVLCVCPCLPPEPKDEVEVSDDGECWPPVLR